MKGFVELPVVDHSQLAEHFASDDRRVQWHDRLLWRVRLKRDRAASEVPEWETLRRVASEIKAHVLAHLDHYLEQFEAQARAQGMQVHWARDAAAHNRIVYTLLADRGVRLVVKSKSMLAEECGLNPYLEARGIEVVETDLGERIVQLLRQPPSHIVTPAIHLQWKEVAQLFHEQLGVPANLPPDELVTVARQALRQQFLEARAAITGVNFAVAETGTLVICTNEGNADLGMHLAPLHIAVMGIEKVIPRLIDLGVFLRLLARSATGQPITVYTTHLSQPHPGQEVHVVLVDNGRSQRLGMPRFWTVLKCIRCGACMNTCPVYRRSGGYSYGAPVPGPIGSVLMPACDASRYRTLPYASTLCGSCRDVCPVQIPLDEQLYAWRQQLGPRYASWLKRRVIAMVAWVLRSPVRYRWSGRLLRWGLRYLPRCLLYASWNIWGRARELPSTPPQSFLEWYRKRVQRT
ncbi:lactate utilization protein B [Rhodothermus profundi]|uniref:L-lactate dehydrogenase complex protein LldF n=1 Tax=Rhodothermus profundi TaxID=633813 RepID=A0A1M6X9L2_9BACT|nr:lactate utilization protein B [Rhodothermus profundi]SHL02475.1 L-lactate dehydrogenase complex protein LldF [Rhodothermus profundi]